MTGSGETGHPIFSFFLMFLKFVTAKNLIDPELVDGCPWDFVPESEDLAAVRATPKDTRRKMMLKPDMKWNTYSAVRGVAPNRRVGGDNPAAGLRGLVADYDLKSTVPTIIGYLDQIPEAFVPNFIEVSLSMKARLVWIFEKEILTPDSSFCSSLVETMFKKMGVPTLLPGYDECSIKPTTFWTNGGEWHDLDRPPMPWDLVFGMAVDVSKKSDMGRAEIPLEIIAAEVQKRWPGRWQGPFELNNLGVRFWDETADNTTGAQIKPDGLICYTGTKPFVRWAELFGIDWVNKQRSLNLGKAAGEVYFDGRWYYKNQGGTWFTKTREDSIAMLKTQGVSAKVGKGQTASDAERVLVHIQDCNRVSGAAPLVNYRPGLVEYGGKRILNVSTLRPFEPAAKLDANPEEDFPWLWHFLNGIFTSSEHGATDFFFAWLQRFYRSFYEYEPAMGQAVFLCGPKSNGKTLISERIISPLVGGSHANPYPYFNGETSFNADLFSALLLAMNDADSVEERNKTKFLAKIKSFVVNPSHAYHQKFTDRVTIPWTGRLFVSLNDDPSSVGILCEVNSNTQDKLSFLGSKPYAGTWGSTKETNAVIAKELPFFARWLLDTYKPPTKMLVGGRIGVESFFDARILQMSQQQSPAFNLLELLQGWSQKLTYWGEGIETWRGNASDLMECLTTADTSPILLKDWNAFRAARALMTLARVGGAGIESVEGANREFIITKSKLKKVEAIKS